MELKKYVPSSTGQRAQEFQILCSNSLLIETYPNWVPCQTTLDIDHRAELGSCVHALGQPGAVRPNQAMRLIC